MGKERPILFSAPMIRAILDSRKTQTRRLIKPSWMRCLDPEDDGGECVMRCPYGLVGDLLWAQEGCALTGYEPHAMACHYLADDSVNTIALTPDEWVKYLARKHPTRPQPGRFMYRSASRITLAVESVRVERLHDITDDDAKAEGVTPAPFCKAGRPDGMEHVEAFEALWCEINGEKSWQANPWVWRISFSRVTP